MTCIAAFQSYKTSFVNNVKFQTTSSTTRSCLHTNYVVEVKPQCNFKTNIVNKRRKKYDDCFVVLATNSDFDNDNDSDNDNDYDLISSVPHSETVKLFYECINEKDVKQIEEIVSDDCFLEDSYYSNVFQGKKEVLSFLNKLVESMGKNVRFKIGQVCAGKGLIASVDWHLEWEEKEIPLSKGCSIFQFSKEGDGLVMKNVRILTEPTVKPGHSAMALLRTMSKLFDHYPKAAAWLLRSPHAALQFVKNVYNLFLVPILNKVFPFRDMIWKIISHLLHGFMLSVTILLRLRSGRKEEDDNSNSNS